MSERDQSMMDIIYTVTNVAGEQPSEHQQEVTTDEGSQEVQELPRNRRRFKPNIPVRRDRVEKNRGHSN